jgi:chromosome segregation ATPase
LIDHSILAKEVDALRSEGLNNRQIATKIAEIISYRFRERPTQALIMDLLRDRDAGKCPSASTIQAGLKDFQVKQAEQRKGPLGPESWPNELRVEATEVLANLDRWATAKAEKEVDAIRRRADLDVSEALTKVDQAARDRELALNQAAVSDDERKQAQEARERAEKSLVDARARIDEMQTHAAHLSDSVTHLQAQLEETRSNHEVEKAEREADFKQQMDRLLGEYHRDKDANLKEISRLEQLLTAGEETIKRLRMDVQREVDRSEAMRSELAGVREEIKSANTENIELRLQLAERNGRLDGLEKDVARLSKLRGQVIKSTKRLRRPSLQQKKRGTDISE